LGNEFPAQISVQSKQMSNRSSYHLPLRSKKTANGTYQLGPFIAILTSDSRKPFAGNHRNFTDLILMGKRMGITVYVLTPKGILSGKPFVKGHLLQQTTPVPRFSTAILPFPNVIYNRIPNRIEEQSTEVQTAIHLLQHKKKIPMFNLGFFNKWSLYRNLSNTSSSKRYLPVTRKLTNFATFQQMIHRFPQVFLKPVDGKAGIGMMKIEGKGPFLLTYQTKKKKQRILIPIIQKLYQQVRLLSRKQEYVLQQGISLATYQGRPFDIRMLVQKDETNQWKVSGIGVRVAGENAISTHIPMGGKIEEVNRVLSTTFPRQKTFLLKQLAALGIRFAQEIEARSGVTHGEMSMDIGIDQEGKLWFFEANSKPQKFDEPDIRERSLRRIMEYSLYLSGFHRLRQRIHSR
jgi:hypothetical protein